MYEEAFEGIKYTNREIAGMFGKTFEVPSDGNSGGAVVIKDISVFSYCEHHMALMYDMKVDVAYVPRGRVLGLSKIARICDMAAKRLQLQERLGVRIEGCHSCMTSRGIKNVSSKTVTKTYFGAFKDDVALQNLLGDRV